MRLCTLKHVHHQIILKCIDIHLSAFRRCMFEMRSPGLSHLDMLLPQLSFSLLQCLHLLLHDGGESCPAAARMHYIRSSPPQQRWRCIVHGYIQGTELPVPWPTPEHRIPKGDQVASVVPDKLFGCVSWHTQSLGGNRISSAQIARSTQLHPNSNLH